MLRIGWASRDITPPRPAMLYGQMHRRIASKAMDPLTVTALALEGREPADSVVFISCDLCAPPESLYTLVRARLARQLPALPADRVILFATHTHTSLTLEDGIYEYPGGEVMSPAECQEWVASRIVEAAAEAWETKQPRILGRAFGHAVVGHNRYAVYANGQASMYGQTNREDFAGFGGYEDHSLDMLFCWEPDGSLAGLVLAIPCPSQVDEGLEQFSADYWHEVRVELRARLGKQLQLLPICSAAGDQSPHLLLYQRQEEEMRRRRGVTERQEIAQRVAEAVLRALKDTRPEPAREWPLAHRVKNLELPPWRITQAQRDWAQAEYEKRAAKGDKDSWWPKRLREVVACFDGLAAAQPLAIEIHVLRVGEAAIATSPFELFLDYGLQIKARSAAAQTITIQLAGSRLGSYLPSERSVNGGGYGASPAVARVGPEGGRVLVAQTLALIHELFPAKPQ